MDESKKTIEEVAQIVDAEGLDYAIMEYMSADSIEDPALKQAWEEAYAALWKVENMLEPYYE